jgi:hypothetical protein
VCSPALQGVITTYWLLAADPFALGVVEAVVLPAMLVFLSHWFTSPSAGARTASSSSAIRSR